jgi:hypothetical protein
MVLVAKGLLGFTEDNSNILSQRKHGGCVEKYNCLCLRLRLLQSLLPPFTATSVSLLHLPSDLFTTLFLPTLAAHRTLP